MIKSLSLLFFSPAGSTRRVVSRIGSSLASSVAQFNLLQRKIDKKTFGEQDVVVVGVPVYGGRVPEQALRAVRNFSGTNTPVVSVVAYGNRAYEDALLELNDTLRENGFTILASGAFVARHSIAREIAAGRPDAEDRDEIDSFCARVLDKYAKQPREEWGEVVVPGNKPYRKYVPPTVVPYTDENCTRCGSCVHECPSGALTLEATDASKCFLCMRCVSVCPRQARRLPGEYLDHVLAFLRQACPGRSPNEVFL